MRACDLTLVVVSTLVAIGAAGCNGRSKDHSLRSTRATSVAGATSATTAAPSSTSAATASGTAAVVAPAPAIAAAPATPPDGSPFWYEKDTLGNPLQAHTPAEAALVADVMALMNAERAKVGLQPFVLDIDAERAAKAHAEDMTDRDYFSHVTPEGWTPHDRLVRLAANPWQGEAENIAFGAPAAADVVAAWMGSPQHRANILSPTFDLAGVGLAGGSTPRWVTVFLIR